MPHANIPFPVDGHVHFHRHAAVGPTLDAAARNFGAASGRTDGLLGAVLLTQAASERVFETLQGTSTVGDWALVPVSAEPQTLIARRGAVAIAIVCGRQIRAMDGLEVLALGTSAEYADGMSLASAVADVQRSGALVAVPWGFGKWVGVRGEAVERVLLSSGPGVAFVGDNGSRLALVGRPKLMRSLESRGFRVLPGTDPFPFAGGYRDVGRFGFMVDVEPPESAPWGALRRWIERRSSSPPAYGAATGATRFVLNQVGIQVYNRTRRSAPA